MGLAGLGVSRLSPWHMLTLAFDTTMAACSAAVYDSAADVVLASTQLAMDRGHAEAVAPMVQAVLQKAGVVPEQLDRIAVTTGPGTFTGLRIGLSLAHGMGVALGCEVAGIDTLTATAAPLLPEMENVFVVHHAGGTGKFYMARFENGSLASGIEFTELDTCVALAGPTRLPLIGTGADRLMAAAPNIFTRIDGHDLPTAAAFVRYAAALPKPTGYPQPVYLREPDAKPSVAFHAVTVRLATAADVAAMSKLHGMCFAAGWSEESIRTTLSLAGAGALVAELGGTVRAFLQYRIASDEAEIITLCTEPRWRRRALAEKLVLRLRELLRVQNINKLHLEVAADNRAAEALYRKLGFAVTGRRKDYYARKDTTPVDAAVMSITP